MTAVARNVSLDPRFLRGTRTCEKVLKNAHIYRGTVALAHNNRAMPAATLNNATVVAEGGPFPIAGADANGGLRLISLMPNVRFAIITGGTTPVVTVAFGATIDITVTQANTTTAAATVAALLAHPVAWQYLRAAATGTGASAAGTQAMAALPHVRVLGVSAFEIDNTPNPTTDTAIPTDSNEFHYGDFWLLNDSGNPLTTTDVPGFVPLLDNVTVRNLPSDLLLFFLRALELDSNKGVCVEIP